MTYLGVIPDSGTSEGGHIFNQHYFSFVLWQADLLPFQVHSGKIIDRLTHCSQLFVKTLSRSRQHKTCLWALQHRLQSNKAREKNDIKVIVVFITVKFRKLWPPKEATIWKWRWNFMVVRNPKNSAIKLIWHKKKSWTGSNWSDMPHSSREFSGRSCSARSTSSISSRCRPLV